MAIPLTGGVLFAVTTSIAALPIFCGIVLGELPFFKAIFRGNTARWRIDLFYVLASLAILIAAGCTIGGLVTSGISLAQIGLQAPSTMQMEVTTGFAILVLIGSLHNTPSISIPAPTTPPAMFLPHTRNERLAMVFLMAPIAGFGEELVYRGLFLQLLLNALGFWIANGIQSAVFGFHHGGFRQPWFAWLYHCAFAFTLGLIARWTHGLALPMLLHFAWNASTAARPVKPC
jgi:membrane protease YdiL (CAAX protease family)